jgi:predicted GNAT family acetyltransferase
MTVIHNTAQSRFETTVDGQLAKLDYHLRDSVIVLVHTEVPKALEGRGLGASLVQAALAHAREAGLKVEPRCAYAAAYMQRHPETQDLLAP